MGEMREHLQSVRCGGQGKFTECMLTSRTGAGGDRVEGVVHPDELAFKGEFQTNMLMKDGDFSGSSVWSAPSGREIQCLVSDDERKLSCETVRR